MRRSQALLSARHLAEPGKAWSQKAAWKHSEKSEGPYAWSGTQRPDIDGYLERLPLILDRDTAKQMWNEYQELLVDEQPFTFVYQSDRLDGVNKRVRGMVMDIRGEWVNVRDWWIPSDERRGRAR